MGKIISSERLVVWIQEDGNGTPFVPFAVGEKASGMTGKTIPGTTTTPVYSRDANGRPLLIKQNIDVPGGTPSATLSVYERGQVDFLREALIKGCTINVQSRISECGSLINPNSWSAIDHWSNGRVGDYTPGDGPSLGFAGDEVTNEATVSFDSVTRIVQTSLSALTITETEDILAIAGLSDENCGSCGDAYPGADKLLAVGAAAGAAVEADVWVSLNGGGTWTVITDKAFAADEDISEIEMVQIGNGQVRIIVGTDTTDAAAPAKIAYLDALYGAIPAGTWTNVSLASGANGDVIQAMKLLSFSQLYIASAGDIFKSDDRGETDPGAAVYTGTEVINGFEISPDGSEVWAFGANNTLLREIDDNDTFAARVGPSGGGAFTALTIADNGVLYAGNGTSIYKSVDSGATTGNWTELKDFGANYSITSIQVIRGESELLRVVVTDSTGTGNEWYSVDGGASWAMVTEVTNTGYTDAYWSKIDANKGVITGLGGVIHALLPT